MYPTKKLWEICKVIKWKNPELFLEVWEWKIPYLTAKFIRWLQFPNFALVSDKKSTLVNKKDIVIICDWSNSGETFIGLEWILSSTMWKLAFNQDIDTLFINHFLVLIIKELKTRRFWAAIPHLDIKWLLSYEIPLPPLSTQKLIVQKLDSSFEKIDKSIEITKKNLENLEELNKSVLEKVFSEWEYEIKTIDKVFKIKSWNFLPKSKMIESWEVDVYWWNWINWKHNEYNLNWENIIIWRVWALCWNVRYIEWKIWLTDNAFYISDYLINIDKKYLNKFLSFRRLWTTSNASAQPVISYKSIQEIQIPLPALQKQKEIVTYLDQVFEKNKELKTKYDEQLKELEELKQSLLKDAFDGRLVKE